MCMGKRFDISTLVSFCRLQVASPKHFCQETWVGGYWKDEKCAFSEERVTAKPAAFQESGGVTRSARLLRNLGMRSTAGSSPRLSRGQWPGLGALAAPGWAQQSSKEPRAEPRGFPSSALCAPARAHSNSAQTLRDGPAPLRSSIRISSQGARG